MILLSSGTSCGCFNISGWQTSPIWEIQDKAVQVEIPLLLSSIVLYISGNFFLHCLKTPSVPLDTRINRVKSICCSPHQFLLKCTTIASKQPIWMKMLEISMTLMTIPKALSLKHNPPNKPHSQLLQPSIIIYGVICSLAVAHSPGSIFGSSILDIQLAGIPS